MKRYLSFLLLLVATGLHAQSFEGSITWSVQSNLADKGLNKGMAFVFPSQLTLHAAGKNWLLAIKQGESVTETIWVGDSNHYYRLDPKAKTYSMFAPGGRQLADSLLPIAEKKDETQVIQGYTCNKYLVHLNRNDSSMQQVFWVTTAIHINGMETMRNQGGEPVFYKNMEGVPLRVEVNSREMSLVVAATQIQKGVWSAGNVLIPTDFKKLNK